MNQHPTPPSAAATEQSSVGVVIASVAVLLLLAALDQTIVSTALPTIVADLGGLDHLSWVVTAYILASTVVAPLYGKFGDLYGRRVVVFVAVGLFLAGSAWCGIAQSMVELIVARAVQGLGGGGLFVLALSIIGDVIQPKDRGKLQGMFAGVFSLSSVAGPLLGGWFVEHLSWHWIFYVNLPFGILALVGFALGFKAHPRRVVHRIDYEGAALLTVALGSMVLFTSLGGRTFAWDSPQILVLIVLSIAGLVGFVVVERRAKEPILPLGLFRLNVFWVTSIVGLVAGAALFGAVTFLPLYLQIAKGSSPMISGLQLIPMTLGIVISSTFAGRAMARTRRYRLLLIVGMAFLPVGALMLSALTADSSWLYVLCSICVFGLGMGFVFPVVTTAVQNAVPREVIGAATASGVMFRQVGGSLAVALFGAIFASLMASSLASFVGPGGHLPEIGPQFLKALPPELHARVVEAVVSALHPIFWIAAGLAVIGLLVSFRLEDGELVDPSMRGREAAPPAEG